MSFSIISFFKTSMLPALPPYSFGSISSGTNLYSVSEPVLLITMIVRRLSFFGKPDYPKNSLQHLKSKFSNVQIVKNRQQCRLLDILQVKQMLQKYTLPASLLFPLMRSFLQKRML
ncbi:hypothetical protein Bhyg_17511 [Pseudolycoriella hygida]|uniref:Uncharacterized protein n=1 Tax=Pseudolycoriella hygida TaxID=35572 RepID=A0A9Q0RS24_9DIPT|nr:hypothetical protein Bhyg_17511 [Pseudolycoriella hygida]